MNLLTLKKYDYSLEDYRKAEYVYDSCSHILICSSIDPSSKYLGGYEHRKYGCIKCGLDTKILYETHLISLKDKIMKRYLSEHISDFFKGIETEIICDLNLAKAIYSKIKSAHPNIDDETIIKYIEIALDNIRNIEVNEERKVDRAKRLLLNPKFSRWNSNDICYHEHHPLVNRS